MHSTKTIDDGYMGSSLELKSRIKSNSEQFTKEILQFANSRSELAQLEQSVVTRLLLDNEKCLNKMVGGNGSWSYINKTRSLEDKSRIGRLGGLAAKEKTRTFWSSFWKDVRSGKILHPYLGRKRVTTDLCRKHLSESKMRFYHHNDSARKQLSDHFRKTITGRKWMNNGSESSLVLPSDVQQRLDEGWIFGRWGLP